MMTKKWINSTSVLAMALSASALSANAIAADYKIDTKGAHASVNFQVSHLGYSFIQGRFNDFEGEFSYDPDNIEASRVKVVVDTSSLDSNHAERDKHLRSGDFLDTKQYPKATFTSNKVTDKGQGQFVIDGQMELHGKTVPVSINAEFIGAGKDPWGGERAGFKGTTRLEFKDFGIKEMGASTYATLELHVEGIKQ